MKYAQKEQRMGKGHRLPCFALVMVRRSRNVYYSGSQPVIDGTLKLSRGAINIGTICKSAGQTHRIV